MKLHQTSTKQGSFMMIVTVIVSPISCNGTVKLKSNNPFDKPLTDSRYLSSDFDIFTVRKAVKAILRFTQVPGWSDYIIVSFGDTFTKAKTSDAQIESYIRGLTTTIYHPVGTASMSSATAKICIVNPDLTVEGTEGLRIVDTSVFPFVPGAHTQIGPIAERASDVIKAAEYQSLPSSLSSSSSY